jgi:ATP-dependent DNA helicase DinG
MDISKRFSMPAVIAMRREIIRADGNEVFFAGTLNENGIVTSVTAASRGTEDAVPVNFTEAGKCGVLIHNHPSGLLKPSEADLGVASDASGNGQGFYIINNEVTDVYAVMEPVKPKTICRLDSAAARTYLADGGPLSKLSEAFEERPVQIDLLEKIVDSFNRNAIGVFEAGTGVGKSYAYLIPAMLWADRNQERVVISTGTINLQQQLIEKDIPAAERITGKKIKAVLVKGRQNYVCLRRLEDASKDRDMFSEDTEILDQIADWAKNTPTGSSSDLPFVPPGNIWTRINSESDACMGMRCPYHEKCFVMRVRKEAAGANLLVVNHHLLFADIESRMNGVGYDDAAVLPPYRRVIFDEAHGIESAATSFFSGNLTRFRLLKQLGMLYRQRHGAAAGYIFTLQILSSGADHTNDIISGVNDIKECITNLELASADLLGQEAAMRLYDATVRGFGPVISLLSSLGEKIAAVAGHVREIMEDISDDDKDIPQYWETKAILRRLDESVVLCKNFSAWDEKRDIVFWIQRLRLSPALAKGSENPVYIQFTQTPLDIAPLMNTGIFEPMESVVCTSATLSIGRNFGFWMRRVGISFVEKERLLTGEFPSPFPYKTHLLFAVPSDAPFPENPDYQQYIENAIVSLIKAANGRTLILFTSYESLKNACNTARAFLQGTGINVLKQGDDDRFRLLDEFKNDTSSVLFATDSFWQGIDVPGDSLSQVIIVKLPFGVPNDPVFAARSDAVQKRGGSPFMELSLPEAVIKFRQGFGRLIRRSDDRGAVIVLDRRIIEKQYGKLFLDSIPDTIRVYVSLSEIADKVAGFLDRPQMESAD